MIEQLERTKVSFQSGGVEIVGYLYSRAGAGELQPGVILATGFGGTQDTPSIVANAEKFAETGFTALTFDYRSFGESGGEPRQVIHIQDQLADIHAAIAYARSLPGIDPDRIALWGSSLGGGHVVTAAADDPRIAAVVAQVPFNGFSKKVEDRSTLMTLRLLAAMLDDSLRARSGRPPRYIPAVGAPGSLAVMASAQAKDLIDDMQSPTWRNEVAPRALVEMMQYKPGDRASEVRAPLLVSVGEYDRETQGVETTQLAESAPRGELRRYPISHFEIYRPEIREQVTADQIEFLKRHLIDAV